MILNAASTNLEMSKCYRGLNLRMSQKGSKEWMERWTFPSSLDAQMHFGSKQGTLLKTTLFFRRAKPSAFESF